MISRTRTAASLAALAIATFAAAPIAQAQTGAAHHVAIEYQDLSNTQGLSSAPFVSHAPGFHFFELGKPATVLLQVLAEEGNPEFLVGTAIGDPKTFLDEAIGLPSLPGKGRRVVVSVDAEHPLVSGGWMLAQTNDGFAGIDAVDAFHLSKPVVMEVYPLDAGTEKNTESKADTVGGLGRVPEHGVIARHPGIRGDADIAASFKFDPSKPVGRITITPLGPNS